MVKNIIVDWVMMKHDLCEPLSKFGFCYFSFGNSGERICEFQRDNELFLFGFE